MIFHRNVTCVNTQWDYYCYCKYCYCKASINKSSLKFSVIFKIIKGSSKKKNSNSKGYLHPNVDSSNIYYSHIMETAQVSIY